MREWEASLVHQNFTQHDPSRTEKSRGTGKKGL